MTSTPKWPNFQGTVREEASIVNPDYLYQIKRLKDHIKANPTDFSNYVSAISSLFPASGGSLDQRLYWTIEFSDIIFDHPLAFEQESLNLCIVFKSCKFKEIKKIGFPPIVFEDCEIETLEIDQGAQNLHVVGKGIKILNFKSFRHSVASHMTFKNLRVEKCIGPSSKLARVLFENVIFNEFNLNKSELTKVKFIDVSFVQAPDFIAANIDKSVVFVRSKFLDFSFDAPVYYRELRKLTHTNNDEEMANLFGALEIKARYRNTELRDDAFDKLVGLCYSLINDFGINIFKPLKNLVGLFCLSYITFFVIFNRSVQLVDVFWSNIDFLSPLKISFLSCLGPLRLLSKFENVSLGSFKLELIFWLFTLISTLLWYFLIVGVRKRYKVM